METYFGVQTSETYHEVRRLLLDGDLDRPSLLAIVRQAQALADQKIEATHVIDFRGQEIRPMYLDGTLGVKGRRRGGRYEFRPVPGTRAYEKNHVWRISENLLRPISQ
jgi:hypothetical protein